MRFLRSFEWTIRVCGILVKDAASFPLLAFLPPLLTIVVYLILHGSGVDVPVAFVTSYVLGYSVALWLRIPWMVQQFKHHKWWVWWIVIYPMAIIATVLLLQTPAIALRLAYLGIAVRISVLLIDLTDGTADVVRRLWPDSKVLAYEGALTRVLFLRDVAMILLAETIILVGSVPLMLIALAFWQMLHQFVDRIVVVSVLLVSENEKGR